MDALPQGGFIMKKRIEVSLAACALFLAAFVLAPGMAAACTYQCVALPDEGPLCGQCVDTAEFTGGTCEEDGHCHCQYTLNTCGSLVAGITVSSDLAAITALEKGGVCPARSHSSGLPAALLN
jgi:hypothetical protein